MLFLACTEVEAQFKGIHKAHHAAKPNYSTKDYVTLKDVLKLEHYEVKFPLYPELKSFKPFENWVPSNPTKSLFWYDNYNAVKHNSETEFAKASLESAVSAICAFSILLKAQYGIFIPFWKEQLGSFYEIQHDYEWQPDEMLLPPYNGFEWKEKKHPF